MEIFSKNFKPMIIGIAIAIVFGFLAGIISGTLTAGPAAEIQLANDASSNIPELVKLRQFIGLKQDLQAQSVFLAVRPALAGFYKKKAQSKDLANQIYGNNDFLGNGFILTNNGWLLTTKEVLGNFSKSNAVAMIDQSPYDIDEIISDGLTGVLFVKIKAVNLPVVKLGKSDEVELGQSVLLLNSLAGLKVVNIESLTHKDGKDVIDSSEKLSAFFVISEEPDNNYAGGVLVNLNGEVIGIISGGKAITVNKFESLIDGVVKSSAIQRPYFGASYIDIGSALGLDPKIIFGLTKGALIYNVNFGSPAAEAGFKNNDIITKIDGKLVSTQNSLVDLIQSYRVGDLIYVTAVRGGQEFTVEVYLGAL